MCSISSIWLYIGYVYLVVGFMAVCGGCISGLRDIHLYIYVVIGISTTYMAMMGNIHV